ncbi:MAG: hypothetical protein NW205_03820 [Hyphomicrobiaceae bacterium]|nr:hypothetical protein [Hyphomicrobiaceae bacterium]
MSNDTKKLAGPAKDRFFRRLFASDPALDIATADRLAVRTASLVTSLRVRQAGLSALEKEATLRRASAASAAETLEPGLTQVAALPEPKATDTVAGAAAEAAARAEPGATPTAIEAAPAETQPSPPASAPPSTFDPFVFGLVPVFKRHGADALIVRLAEIASADDLRAMAKAQQIVLPREIRTGPIDLVTLRTAILDAVEKRVADRKASL